MPGNFNKSKGFDVFEKYGIEYMPPKFVEILKPWGDTEYYVLEEATKKPEIRNQIDKVNANAISAPAGDRVNGDCKIKECFKYRQSLKILLKILKRDNVKLYTWEEKEKYIDDYNNKKLRELQQAQEWL